MKLANEKDIWALGQELLGLGDVFGSYQNQI
jgi:hypothetical protein